MREGVPKGKARRSPRCLTQWRQRRTHKGGKREDMKVAGVREGVWQESEETKGREGGRARGEVVSHANDERECLTAPNPRTTFHEVVPSS